MPKFRIFKEQPLNNNYLNPQKDEIKSFFQQKNEKNLPNFINASILL